MTDSSIGNAIIIDVREPKEFKDYHLDGAINLPSTAFEISQFTPFQHQVICLVCQTGNRAGKVKEKLLDAGFKQVTLLGTQMDRFEKESSVNSGGWSVDRQFRITLGILLASFLVGQHFGLTGFIVIPLILCIGLIFTSIIDRCYMRMGIAMLPWNRKK